MASSDRSSDWVSASELAEYAFCPRAHYLRSRYPTLPVAGSDARRVERGQEFHARGLGAVERRESVGLAGPVLAILVGLLLLALLLTGAL